MLITRLTQLHGERLTDTDRRLINAIRASPHDMVFAKAIELTQPLGLHESAATRLAQRLGFDGYPQLREALRNDYLNSDGPSQRVRARLERSEHSDVLTSLIEQEIKALESVALHVTGEALEAGARRILAAERVFLHGQGNATALVELFARRLTRYGLTVVPLTGSRRDIAERAAGMRSGDLLLACVFRRPTSMLLPLLALCEEESTPSLLLTDTLVSLAPRPDLILAAPRGEERDFHTLTVPMAIANALILTIAQLDPDSAATHLDRVQLLQERLEP